MRGGMSHDTLSFSTLMGNVHPNRHKYTSVKDNLRDELVDKIASK